MEFAQVHNMKDFQCWLRSVFAHTTDVGAEFGFTDSKLKARNIISESFVDIDYKSQSQSDCEEPIQEDFGVHVTFSGGCDGLMGGEDSDCELPQDNGDRDVDMDDPDGETADGECIEACSVGYGLSLFEDLDCDEDYAYPVAVKIPGIIHILHNACKDVTKK